MTLRRLLLAGIALLLLSGCGDKLAPGDDKPRLLALDYELIDEAVL